MKLRSSTRRLEEKRSDPPFRNKSQQALREITEEGSLHLPASLAIIDQSWQDLEDEMVSDSVLDTEAAWAPSRRKKLAQLASPLSTTKPQAVRAPPLSEDGKPDVRELERTLTAPKPGELTGASSKGTESEQWHEIAEREFTPEEQRDLRIIENRQHIDPKRFYKSTGTGRKRGELPTRVHFGTIVVGPHEFYSARLTRRERKSRIIDEVLGDERLWGYARKRSSRIRAAKNIGKRVVDPASKKQRRQRRQGKF